MNIIYLSVFIYYWSVLTETVADIPGIRLFLISCGTSKSIIIGTHWTILVKLPVALSVGIKLNFDPVAGDMLRILPYIIFLGIASNCNATFWLGRNFAIWVSLKLAFIYNSFCTTKNNILPGLTKLPICKLLLANIPLTGERILVFVRLLDIMFLFWINPVNFCFSEDCSNERSNKFCSAICKFNIACSYSLFAFANDIVAISNILLLVNFSLFNSLVRS